MASGLFEDLIDSLFGKANTSEEDAKAAGAINRLEKAYSGISTPNRIVSTPEAYKSLGTYAVSDISAPEKVKFELGGPAQVDVPVVGDTSFKDISIDPRLKDSQYSALAALDEIVKGGGLNAQDRAALSRIQGEAAQADRGRREAILQNLGARGMSGSGMELLSQLQSSQAATDRESQAGLDIAGMAQQRALDAIMQQGNLAGGMRSQDFGEQAKLAEARDIIARFNTGNVLTGRLADTGAVNDFAIQRAQGNQRAGEFSAGQDLDVRRFNAGQRTDALKYGKSADQAAADQTTADVNAAMERRDAIPGQQFADKMALGGAKVGTAQPVISYYDNAAGRKVQEEAAKQAAKVGLLTGTASAAASAYGRKKE